MTEELVIPKFRQLPEEMKVEVLHFIEFLETKKQNSSKNIQPNKRIFGISKGKFSLGPEFDEPLDEFKEYM